MSLCAPSSLTIFWGVKKKTVVKYFAALAFSLLFLLYSLFNQVVLENVLEDLYDTWEYIPV